MKKFLPIILLLSVLNGFIDCTAGEYIKQNNQNLNPNPIEFEYSKSELDQMDKWKDKSLDELHRDAMDGDPAALYMIGLCSLYGHGLPINIKAANMYFSASASLGFAPALDKLRCMYLEDNPNIFLALVYINLTISHGHPEYMMLYHQQRAEILKKIGNKYVDEIERIATDKTCQIIENKRKLAEAINRKEYLVKLMLSEGLIKEDFCYNDRYWESLQNPADSAIEIK